MTTTEKHQVLISVALAMAEVCHYDTAIPEIKGRIFRRAKQLLLATIPPTGDLIRALYSPGGWWYRSDFRGKKGDKPTPEWILQTWPEANAAPTPAGERRMDFTGEYAEFINH